MPRIKILSSGDVSEESIHNAVMQWIRLNPSLEKVVMHIPNEGRRTLNFGKRLKDMGMKKGVSDLFIAMSKHNYHGAWIELKSAHGKLSQHQKEFLDEMDRQGYFTSTCWSIDEAINIIKWYYFD